MSLDTLERTPDRVTTDQASILVVEDEEQIRKLVSSGLRRAGYDVITASNGEEALARIAEVTPDLVVSDVMMPLLDGFRLVERLRADPATRFVPVLLLTARGSSDDIVHGLELGADDYLPKPFQMAELLARVKSKVERPPIPREQVRVDRRTGLLAQAAFDEEVKREITRARQDGSPLTLAYLALDELPGLQERLGRRAADELVTQVSRLLIHMASPLEVLGRDRDGRFLCLMPRTEAAEGKRRLNAFSQTLARRTFSAAGEHVRLTPAIGFAVFGRGVSQDQLHERAQAALYTAETYLDLQAVQWTAAADIAWQRAQSERTQRPFPLRTVLKRLRTPAQIAAVSALATLAPLGLYSLLATYWLDITPVVYLVVVVTLLVTACLIWIEGLLALRRLDPPQPSRAYPPATAIIAAYLPNEAAIILETVESFLRQDYPAPLQIVLAYNTPRKLPVEDRLREIAARDPRFVPLKVEASTSKAQNVNAALAVATGEFTGVFDADHHPDVHNFARAWGWLSNGYDVVQGHCLVRNGAESWVARMVAVEFEAIYAVSHPGRARLHGFGVFGGSNGYWKTDLLRQTRMHAFMLTEDIDSSLRAIEAGHRIASDPYLVSRELGTVTLKAVWNQRMRWAQGWFQVSLKHMWGGLRSPNLTPRNKLGIFHLLFWREIYPWVSIQIVPIIAFWMWHHGPGSVDWWVPIFVLTSLFTLSVGPGQAVFAYLLADPQIRRQRTSFALYVVVASLFFTPYKNLISVVAQAKELMGERAWKVTPRQAGVEAA